MFTGIVEEIGTIKRIEKGHLSSRLVIEAAVVLQDANVGDSISTNGVCLTVTTLGKTEYTADVMAETLRRSSLGSLKAGSKVNLERAMAANGRFGGHIVSGHIDGTGAVTNLTREDNAVWVTINTDAYILKYIVEKGSIAIDGISLTVAYVDNTCFKVSVIPHTASNTILLDKKVGDIVNLECDVIGKYIEKLMTVNSGENNPTKSGITMDFLAKHGF